MLSTNRLEGFEEQGLERSHHLRPPPLPFQIPSTRPPSQAYKLRPPIYEPHLSCPSPRLVYLTSNLRHQYQRFRKIFVFFTYLTFYGLMNIKLNIVHLLLLSKCIIWQHYLRHGLRECYIPVIIHCFHQWPLKPPKSEWLILSPFSITLGSTVKIMTIVEMISNLRGSWLSNKLSL